VDRRKEGMDGRKMEGKEEVSKEGIEVKEGKMVKDGRKEGRRELCFGDIQTTNIMSIVSLFLITVGCTDFLKYYYNDTHGSARHLYLIRSNKPQKPFLQIFNQSKPFKIFLKIDGPYGCIVDAWRSVSFFFALTSGCWKYG
jgi:hypothetical protein